MGNWISIYTDELDELKKVVQSRDEAAAKTAIDRYQQKAGNHAKPATIDAIKRIVDGKYETGEQPDGHTLIFAFEHLCRSYAQEAETVEIYVDQDSFPEIFEFVFNSNSDPFRLPMSEMGSPACSHWPPEGVKKYLKLFSTTNLERVRERTDSDYGTELEALCKVLKAASERGQGVFVFFNE
ncbi:MAG TPA: hypothetical protein V6C81_12485 [Planktothrix sp.]|jgi:hypothetical protein